MGKSTAKALTHADLITEMQLRINGLTERDRKLFNHAFTEVARESGNFNLESTEVCINFMDTKYTVVQSNNNPDNTLVVSYDGNGKPTAIWTRESNDRVAYKLFISFLNGCITLGKPVTIAAVGGAVSALIHKLL